MAAQAFTALISALAMANALLSPARAFALTQAMTNEIPSDEVFEEPKTWDLIL